jgi:hypothetical protein
VNCIITDAKKYDGKASFAEIIEQKVPEIPNYSNDYKNKINLIGVTSFKEVTPIKFFKKFFILKKVLILKKFFRIS